MNRHEYNIDVRWSDLDMLGHVNNVVYLVYFESARVEMIRSIHGLTRKEGYVSVVVQSNVSYKVSATYPGELKVVTSIPHIGNTSMTFHQVLQDREGETVYSTADVTVVWVGIGDNRPRPVPDFITQWAASTPPQ